MNYSNEKENIKKEIMTVPNLITAIRFFGTLVVLPLIFISGVTIPLIIATGAIAATDKLDGWYAKKYNAKSLFGKAFDGLTDKVFVYGLIASLAITGVLPIFNLAVAIPFIFTIVRDSLIFKQAFNTRVKSTDKSKEKIADDYKNRVLEKEKEKNKPLTLSEKIDTVKESLVHKLNTVLEESREKEKNPFIVTMPAKWKMVVQCLAILGFMVGALGVSYAYSVATSLFWGMAGCAALDLVLVRKNENKIHDNKIIESDRLDLNPNNNSIEEPQLAKTMGYSDDLPRSFDMEDSNISSVNKPRVKVKSLPGRYSARHIRV